MLFRASLIVFVVIAIVGFGHTSPAFSQKATVRVECGDGKAPKEHHGKDKNGKETTYYECK
jgi:hypothetical protein